MNHRTTTTFSSAYPGAFGTRTTLTPAQVLAFHRLTFGSCVMVDPGSGAGTGGTGGTGAGSGSGEGSGSAGSGDGQGDPAALGDAGKRALDAERTAREAAEKRAKDAEARVAEFEAANLTETEKQAKERERLAKDLGDAQASGTAKDLVIARYEAAEAADLPLSYAKRLVGATPEELQADAKALKAELGTRSKGRPAADPSQGGGSGGGASAAGQSGRDEAERRFGKKDAQVSA